MDIGIAIYILIDFAIGIELCKNKKTVLINRTVFIKVCDIIFKIT